MGNTGVALLNWNWSLCKFQDKIVPCRTMQIDNNSTCIVNKIFSNRINLSVNLPINSCKTFDNFVIGNPNKVAVTVAKKISKSICSNGMYSYLYIYSNSGLGKTHLLHAIANEIYKNNDKCVIALITAKRFMKEVINAMKSTDLSELQKYYTEKIDVLMIDDVHHLENKKGTQHEFFHIVNELHSYGKQLVFTSNISPKAIEGVDKNLMDIFQCSLTIEIQKLDIDTAKEIVKMKSEALSLCLHEEIISLIANQFINSSVREIEAFLLKLFTHHIVMKVDIDIKTVKMLF